MWKPKPLLILSLVVAGAFALVRWVGGGGDDGGVSEPALVFDRIWIDQLPRKPKDTFHTFIAATQEPIGLFHAGSQWKGGYEVFAHTGGRRRAAHRLSADERNGKGESPRLAVQGAGHGLLPRARRREPRREALPLDAGLGDPRGDRGPRRCSIGSRRSPAWRTRPS